MTNATQERRIRREPNTKSWWDSVRRLVRCRCVSLVMEQCCSVGVADHEFPAAVRLTAHDLGRCPLRVRPIVVLSKCTGRRNLAMLTNDIPDGVRTSGSARFRVRSEAVASGKGDTES